MTCAALLVGGAVLMKDLVDFTLDMIFEEKAGLV